MIQFKIYLANLISKYINIKTYYRLSYFYNRGKILKLNNPRNLSEYIIAEIVSGRINNFAFYTDKYLVRQYLQKKGLSEILPVLYGVWANPELIDFNTFPEKFALKLNFGCGFNIICHNKISFDISSVKLQIETWMNVKTFWRAEPHYDLVERVIFLEELIEDSKGLFPIDYKFMCVDGKIDHILVIVEREFGYKLLTFDLNWNKISLLESKYDNDIIVEKPKNLFKMIECANILCEDFDFVRVDLYDTGDRVIFGELTFTPQGGLLRYYTISALERMMVKKISNISYE